MSILRSFLVVSGSIFGSRILGFIRDVIMAATLGSGAFADAFFVAFKVPNLLRRLFAEGAFHVVFVPIFSGILQKDGKGDAQRFSSAAFTMLLLILSAVTVMAEVFMPAVIAIIAPGMTRDPEVFALTVTLARITFPYLPFITFVSLAGGITNSFNRFFYASAAPILLNVAFISCLLGLPKWGVAPAVAAAWAVPIGGLLQVILMIFALRVIHFRLRFSWKFRRHPQIPALLRRMVPAAIGTGVLQLSTLIDMFLASLLGAGSISFLFYADRLNQLPLALIGIALGTVLLPHMTRQIKAGNHKETSRTFGSALTFGMVMGLAACSGLSLLAYEIIQVLFMRGAFTMASSMNTANTLTAYALGLPALICLKISTTTFYAHEDTISPVKFASLSLLVNLILNLSLMPFFAHVGLALSTSLAAWLNLAIQLYYLREREYIKQTGFMINLPLILLVGISPSLWLFLYKNLWDFPAKFLPQAIWLLVAVASTVLIFIVLAHKSGLVNLKRVLRLQH